MPAKLTIYEIAKLAGVSKSTVSRVLTANPRVDAQTRSHVLNIINEYGFVPSINGTGIKGRSQLLGMVVPALSWPLVSEIILGISQVIEHSSYEQLLYCGRPDQEYHATINRIVASKLTAGLIVVTHSPEYENLSVLHSRNFPVVLINLVSAKIDVPRVGTDNIGGAYAAVHHLVSLGHRRIAYIHGPTQFPCAHERYEGYCRALREVGAEPDPLLFFQGDFSPIGGRDAAQKLFNLRPIPTAVFASNDNMAYEVINVARERGVRIPEDIAVVGFDDNIPSAHTQPALTTVRQAFPEMGRCAAQLLLSLLDSHYPLPESWKEEAVQYEQSVPDVEPPFCSINLPARLVIRESCGATLHSSNY